MSLPSLTTLRAQRAFQPLRTFDELPRYHVPLDEICGVPRFEAGLHSALREQRRITVTGRRGSGKSSLIASVLDPFGTLPDHFMPIRIPVATASGELNAGELARLVTRVVATGIGQLDEASQDAARRRVADSWKETLRPRRTSGGLAIPGGIAKLQVDVSEVVREYTLTAGPAELIATAGDLFRTIRAYDVEPILVFDDTDSWFAERAPMAVPFFERALRNVVSEIDCPVVAAVHDAYLELEGFDPARRAVFTATIDLPRLNASQARSAVRAIVGRALDVHEIAEEPAAVFDPDGLDLLAEAYGEGFEMRDIERVLDHSVGLACDLGAEGVNEQIMSQAVLAERT